MKRLHKGWYFLIVLLTALFLAACGGGGGGGSSGDSAGNGGDGGDSPPAPATYAVFTRGQEIILKTATIDDNGGTIEISGTNTALDGASVTFPAGALPGATEISVGYDTGTLALPEGGASSGNTGTIVLHTNDVTNFSQLVEITVPYGEADGAPVPFYVDETGRLHAVLVKNVDTEKKTVTFLTAHASLWTTARRTVAQDVTLDVDVKFRPSADGFKIDNLGSLIKPKGECAGMSAFAEWYHHEKKPIEGNNFYPRYMENVGADAASRLLTGQDVIATRAHTALNHDFGYYTFMKNKLFTSDEYRWTQIVEALRLTGRPVMIFISQNHPRIGDPDNELYDLGFGYQHSILAYGVNEANGDIFVYDPNEPGNDTVKIKYDTVSQRFPSYYSDSYEFTWFIVYGMGTYDLKIKGESFENIFRDAENGFTSDNKPHINITSHQNGQTVVDRSVLLKGGIQSSEEFITQITVWIGNMIFTTNVKEDGSFEMPVVLSTGENKFEFITWTTINGESKKVTPNNLDANPFSLNLEARDPAVMQVTLTWDKPDVDVDLWVIDPTGDHSSYNHMNTADGGELDVDDTDGYGPEHWTLTNNDVIRCGEYKVRVNYFGGNAGTNFTVKLKLYEGTSRETEGTIMSGYLTSSDPWKDYELPIVLDPSVVACVP
jgi:uncharacterized protein YfaP (DUF2135 family)